MPVPSRAGGRWGEGAAIGRPTVVFVHGWGQSRLDLLPQVPAWRAWCDRAVLYDLRGHGEAEGGLSALGHGEEEDLRELLRRLGPGPFILAGFSMGAVIAIQAAGEGGYLERSDRPLRDDPRCSGIGRIRSGRPAMVSATASGAVSIAGVIAHGPYLDFGRAMRARLRAAGYPTRPITDLALLWLRLRGIRHRPVLAAAARVESPLLVICGMDDDVAPAVAAERLAAAAPRGVLHRVRGATHLDAREVDEAGHDAAIDAFVGSLDARTAATP